MKLALAADLHFGSVPEGLADLLAVAIARAAPDLVVIAGDLTLRARHAEFEQAKAWLEALQLPCLVLPGNHDLPYWNLLQRFADPFHRYRLAAGAESLMPTFTLGDGFVLGFNTTRAWQPHLRWQEGVARRTDIRVARQALAAVPDGLFKIVAAHHPFVTVPGRRRAKPVRRARPALEAFAACGVNLLLSGHVHQSFAAEVEVGGATLMAIGAPTALSLRMRGEPNGFFVIEMEGSQAKATLWLGDARGFAPAAETVFTPQRPPEGVR